MEWVGAATSAWFTEERNRVLGQEIPEGEEQLHAYLAPGAEVMRPDAWKRFRVSGTPKEGDIPKAVVNTRWVLAWKMADGQKCVGWPEGFRDPDLKDGNFGASGCVSLPPSHLLVIPLGALEAWEIWSVGIKIPLPKAPGPGWDVFYAPPT